MTDASSGHAPAQDGDRATEVGESAAQRALIQIVATDTAIVADTEAALDQAGFSLPLPARAAWGACLGNRAHMSAIAHAVDGQPLALLGIDVSATRALPWHRIMRVEALGESYAAPVGLPLLRAIADYARSHGRVLTVVVELECRDATAKAQLRAMLTEAGFQRTPSERVSENTLAVDLSSTEEEILASFSRSTRQNIKGAVKHALRIAPVQDPNCGPRMNALLSASLARTGAPPQVMDWSAVLTLCGAVPHRSRVVGVFRNDSLDPSDLVGFAWGLHHGERVEYHTGASDRIPGVRLPILYPALWDLIKWGRQTGGRWFDMGGVTEGTLGSNDALGGISDFKRGFTRVEVSLGEEWSFAPRPFRSRLAGWTTHVARRVREAKRARTQRGRGEPVRPAAPSDSDGSTPA